MKLPAFSLFPCPISQIAALYQLGHMLSFAASVWPATYVQQLSDPAVLPLFCI